MAPFWAKDLKIGNQLINARLGTMADKPAFRSAWKSRADLEQSANLSVISAFRAPPRRCSIIRPR